MSTLAFLPWQAIRSTRRVGRYSLVAYERGRQPATNDPEKQTLLDRLLEGVVDRDGAPISSCTLIQTGPSDLLRDLDSHERASLFRFGELLACAALAERTFFHPAPEYTNRDAFRVLIQDFHQEASHLTVVTRRRDGTAANIMSGVSSRLMLPVHVVTTGCASYDEALLAALLRAQKELPVDSFESLFDAVVRNNEANTDNSYRLPESELIDLVGAFERLGGSRGGREKDLLRGVLQLFTPDSDLSIDDCKRSLEETKEPRDSGTVREIWLRDCFRLRGSLAHGKLVSSYPSSWSLNEHLLLGSYVFPLVLKLWLSQKDLYDMTVPDRARVNVFESLACLSLAREEDCDAWNRFINCERLRIARADAVARSLPT